MSRRWYPILVFAAVSFPYALHAFDMGAVAGMGDNGGIVDQVKIRTESVGDVVFSHGLHGADCASCHPKLFEKKKSNRRITMKAMEQGKSCGGCHNGKTAFNVSGNSCVRCHAGDVVFRLKDPGDATFSHSKHLEMVGCDSCHPKVFKAEQGVNRATMEEMEKGKSCGACHNGSDAFNVTGDCEKCHKM